MIQEIKEYDSDTCLEIGIRIQDIRESRHMKAIELASYLGIGKNQMGCCGSLIDDTEGVFSFRR